MANTIVWADIPVTDMESARRFYGALLQAEVASMEGAESRVALLPSERGDVSADLALSEDRKPSTDGATVYFGSKGDIEGMAARAVEAGGKILTPPTDMGEMVGTIAYVLDSEGDRIGLHTPPQR
jgi:predicted enzyme related to lactoylglutathione lyase